MSNIDTPELKAERARVANRSGRHVVRRTEVVQDGDESVELAYFLTEPKGPQGHRFATDRLSEAEHFYGAKDAERAASFAGVGWEAVAVAALSQRPTWSRLERAGTGVDQGVGL